MQLARTLEASSSLVAVILKPFGAKKEASKVSGLGIARRVDILALGLHQPLEISFGLRVVNSFCNQRWVSISLTYFFMAITVLDQSSKSEQSPGRGILTFWRAWTSLIIWLMVVTLGSATVGVGVVTAMGHSYMASLISPAPRLIKVGGPQDPLHFMKLRWTRSWTRCSRERPYLRMNKWPKRVDGKIGDGFVWPASIVPTMWAIRSSSRFRSAAKVPRELFPEPGPLFFRSSAEKVWLRADLGSSSWQACSFSSSPSFSQAYAEGGFSSSSSSPSDGATLLAGGVSASGTSDSVPRSLALLGLLSSTVLGDQGLHMGQRSFETACKPRSTFMGSFAKIEQEAIYGPQNLQPADWTA